MKRSISLFILSVVIFIIMFQCNIMIGSLIPMNIMLKQNCEVFPNRAEQ